MSCALRPASPGCGASRAGGLRNVAFVQADAQVHQFEANSFDLVMSRFGVMFFSEPLVAFTNFYGATRTGGRLVYLAWQPLERNEWLKVLLGSLAAGRELPAPPVGAPGAFGLADGDQARELLTNAGYRNVEMASVQEPMCFGVDVEAAMRLALGVGLVRGLLADLDDRTRGEAIAALERALRAHETNEGVLLDSAAWLVSASKEA